MSVTPSTMRALGTPAPDFCLPEVSSGNTVSLADFKGQSLLVIFLSRHCPYVKHIVEQLALLGRDYEGKGLGIVGISSNDILGYPDDSPGRLAEMAKQNWITYPILYDSSQEVAKEYRAACTPDFFVFDASHKLVYRGQLDSSRPGSGIPVTGKDLRAALDATLEGRKVSQEQIPSMGCNIKWRKGNEPDYFAFR